MKRSEFDVYRDRFDESRSSRRVFTRDEVQAAWEDGVDAFDLAARNDALAAEYDEILADECS